MVAAVSAAGYETQQPAQKIMLEAVARAVKVCTPRDLTRRPPTTLPSAPSTGTAVKSVATCTTAERPRRQRWRGHAGRWRGRGHGGKGSGERREIAEAAWFEVAPSGDLLGVELPLAEGIELQRVSHEDGLERDGEKERE